MFQIKPWTIILLVVLAVIPALAAHGGTLTDLYDFAGGADGAQPYGAIVVQGGVLYGTTGYGGKKPCKGGCGTVFKLTIASRAEKILHSFRRGTDGAFPLAGLTADGGAFLGTTTMGGNTGCGGKGCGTVFEINRQTGKETVLYRFAGGNDGASPAGKLIKVGNLFYGTTDEGGGTGCSGTGCGTVFQIEPSTQTVSIVYRFLGGADGAGPSAGLFYNNGMFYGTTSGGGSAGFGTVFRIEAATGAEAVLYSFAGGSDGEIPAASLIESGGLLYGTTMLGGAIGCGGEGCGTIFKINPATGKETVLHRFGAKNDGMLPEANLIKVGSLLYGTTYEGGSTNLIGTIFDIDPDTGVETVLHSFDVSDGANPTSALAYVGGTFFGVTLVGPTGAGSIFAFTP